MKSLTCRLRSLYVDIYLYDIVEEFR